LRSTAHTLGEQPPVTPGSSPFHIRGIAYLGHLDWVDAHFPGGRRGFLALLTPPMRAFFEQTFLAISMVDFMPLASAGQVCARALGKPLIEFVEMRSRHQAEVDLHGVYRAMLKLTSAKLVAARLPKMTARYFDFGEVREIDSKPYCARFAIESLPSSVVDWFIGCYNGYVEIVIGAAGGHLPTVDFQVESAPDIKGFPASRMIGTVRWS
jgi:hypothetical protein